MEEEKKDTSRCQYYSSDILESVPEDAGLWSRISSRLFRRRNSPKVRLMPVTLPCLVATGLSISMLITPLGDIGGQVKDWFTADPPCGGGITLAGEIITIDGAPTGTRAFTNSVTGWSKTFGGDGYDSGHVVQQTTDGGYIIAGETSSYGNGEADFWLIKTDPDGNLEWEKTFGGPENDRAESVQQTSDGGYIVTGSTGSPRDIWVIKTDSEGNKEWDKTFGGKKADSAYSVWQTIDGGYIIASGTHLSDNDIDAWLIKIDSMGNLEWERTFDGPEWNLICSVQPTSDGGYIIAGARYYPDVENADAWLIKTDSTGNLVWENTFSDSSQFAGAFMARETSDGGYIINAYLDADGTDRIGFRGTPLACLIKTDSEGELEWDKSFEDTQFGFEASVMETADGGYIVASCASGDLLFFELDTKGNLLSCDKLSNICSARYISQPTSDGGYIITGCEPQPYGDGGDVVLMKIGTTNPPSQPDCFLYQGGEDGEDFRHWRNMAVGFQAEDIDNLPALWSMGFSDSDPEDSHIASQWQIREADGDYSSPVFDSGRDTANLEEIALRSGILDDSTDYYARVRYQDSQGIWSDYSKELSFNGAEARVSETE